MFRAHNQTRFRKNLAVTGSLLAACVALSACANPQIDAARKLDIRGGDVGAEAAREYKRLAHYEDRQMWDRASAIAFSEKAIAANNGVVATAPGSGRALANEDIAAAYRYLNHMRALGADRIAPKATGQAIARLDCWAEQASEGDQPLDGVDNIRGILGDPLDDLAFDNILPSQKTLLKLQETFLHSAENHHTEPYRQCWCPDLS